MLLLRGMLSTLCGRLHPQYRRHHYGSHTWAKSSIDSQRKPFIPLIQCFITIHLISLSPPNLSPSVNLLLRPRRPQTRPTHHIPTHIILPPLIPRIPLLMLLRCADAPMRVVACLVQLPCCGVDAAALGLGDGAVVGGAGAIFEGGAGEFGGYGFVDAGVRCWGDVRI